MSPSEAHAEIEAAWSRAKSAPLDPAPWAALCLACLSVRDVDGANEALDHMEAMGLGDLEHWTGLAERLEALELWPEAYRAWRRVVDEQPRAPAPYRRLARALSHAGELGVALVTLEAALRLAPEDAETHRMLARAHLARGRPDRARHHTRRAKALAPDHPSLPGLIETVGDLGEDGPPPPPTD